MPIALSSVMPIDTLFIAAIQGKLRVIGWRVLDLLSSEARRDL
jgi:hypothetical protein